MRVICWKHDDAQPLSERCERRGMGAGRPLVEIAYVDQGYIGERAKLAAKEHGIELVVVKLPEARRGFVLLPRRWVVERSFGWLDAFADWPGTTSGYGKLWRGCTFWASPASCSSRWRASCSACE